MPYVTDLQVLGHGSVASRVTDFGFLRHGYWMRKVRVVELRICRGSGGFGGGGERVVSGESPARETTIGQGFSSPYQPDKGI